jgi:hypothetical protein
MTDADGTGNQGFRVRKDEEYEKDQEWKRWHPIYLINSHSPVV